MASLLNIESFFTAFTGEKQLEIDFPFDQYFRKIGVYLRLILAAILIGYSFSASVTCYPPGNGTYHGANSKVEDLRAAYVNAFCFSSGWYINLKNDSSEEEVEYKDANLYLFNYYPYALILEAFLSNVPYLFYVVLTKARIQPVLGEAVDMVLLTTGAFETVRDKQKRPRRRDEAGEDDEAADADADDSDFSDDEEHYAKSLQTSMKKRLYAKMSLFVTQRLLAMQGCELLDDYLLCHIIIKSLVVFLQWTLMVFMLVFSFPFPWQLHCPLSPELQQDTELKVVTCLFPYNQWISTFVLIDILITVFLPILSAVMHFKFWRVNFYDALYQASYLVHPNTRKTFRDFVSHICSYDAGGIRVGRKADDLRLILALLHSNVDQFIANKIMTVYAGRFHFEKSDKMAPDEAGKGCCGCLRSLRPKLELPEWHTDGAACG